MTTAPAPLSDTKVERKSEEGRAETSGARAETEVGDTFASDGGSARFFCGAGREGRKDLNIVRGRWDVGEGTRLTECSTGPSRGRWA